MKIKNIDKKGLLVRRNSNKEVVLVNFSMLCHFFVLDDSTMNVFRYRWKNEYTIRERADKLNNIVDTVSICFGIFLVRILSFVMI